MCKMKYLIVSLLLLCISSKILAINNDTLYHPVILIPGDGGSRAYSTVDYKLIKVNWLLWVNYEFMVLPSKLSEYFSLRYDPKTGTTSNAPGSEVIFPGWGDTKMIEELDDRVHIATTYFSPLVKFLTANKFYKRNFTLRGTPYDFRKAPNENLDFVPKMKKLVEETFINAGGKRRVVILGHSLGNLYTLFFFNKMTVAWKQKYIESYVSVSSPLGGAVKALKLETTGDSLGSPRSELDFRDMQRTFPSTAFLLPQPYAFGKDFPVVFGPKRHYTISQINELFKDINFKEGPAYINNTWKLMLDADGNDLRLKPPTGISNIHCIYGTNINTTYQLIWNDEKNFNEGSDPQLIKKNGDGTVNYESLALCQKWHGVKYTELDQADHMRIVADKRFLSILEQVLSVKKYSKQSFWMSKSSRLKSKYEKMAPSFF